MVSLEKTSSTAILGFLFYVRKKMRVTIDKRDFVFPATVRNPKEKFADRALLLSVLMLDRGLLFWVKTPCKTQTITYKNSERKEKN